MDRQASRKVRRAQKSEQQQPSEVGVHLRATEEDQQSENREEHDRQQPRTEHGGCHGVIGLEQAGVSQTHFVRLQALQSLRPDRVRSTHDRLASQDVSLRERNRVPSRLPSDLGRGHVRREANLQM